MRVLASRPSRIAQVSRPYLVIPGRYGHPVAESWWVTIRGQSRKFVTCAQVTFINDSGRFLAFLDHGRALLLLVPRDEFIWPGQLAAIYATIPAAALVATCQIGHM